MKIQEIQFPLNLGIADELRVFTREDLETENSIVVHYILIDTTKITDLGEGQQLPYKVLHSDKTTIEGEDYLAYKQDSNSINSYISNLLGVTPIEE
jgi:hypothetical protein